MKNKETKIPTSGAAMYNVQEENKSEEKVLSKREEILLAKKKRLQRQRIGSRPIPSNLK